MADFESVFDNSGTSPALEGQGQYEGTESTEPEQVEVITPEPETLEEPEGQVVAEPETQPEAEPDYKALYESTKKAYDNIRPAFTRATQELSKFKQPVAEDKPVQAPTTTTQTQRTPQEEQVAQMIDGIVNQAMAPLRKQQSELVMQSEVAKFKATTKDFDEQAPKMYEILESMPQLWNVGEIGTVLQTAYKLAKIDTIESQIPALVAKAQNDAYASKVVKEANSTDKTRTSNQTTVERSPAEKIRDGILDSARKSSGSVF